MLSMSSGFLLVLEGIDGSGKTTLAKNLAHLLREQDLPIVETREPGKTELGLKLRSLLQGGSIFVCQKAEYLLFAANRAQHFHEIIMPGLAEKKLIVSDRLSDSSLVYQGYARGLDIDFLTIINRWSMDNRLADLVIYVRTSVEVASERMRKRSEGLSSFEKDQSFIKCVYEGYEKLVATRPDVIVVDGNLEPAELAQITCEKVMSCLNTRRIISS